MCEYVYACVFFFVWALTQLNILCDDASAYVFYAHVCASLLDKQVDRNFSSIKFLCVVLDFSNFFWGHVHECYVHDFVHVHAHVYMHAETSM